MSLKDVKDKLNQLAKTKVKAGWFSKHKYPDGTPIAYVATIQEYGYHGGGVNIPPRPFMRPAEADHKKEWAMLSGRVASNYLAGKSGLDTDIVGESMVDGIAKAIISGSHTPLSQITLLLRKWRKEGTTINKSTVEQARRQLAEHPETPVSANSTPLHDTGAMLISLSYNVESK